MNIYYYTVYFFFRTFKVTSKRSTIKGLCHDLKIPKANVTVGARQGIPEWHGKKSKFGLRVGRWIKDRHHASS